MALGQKPADWTEFADLGLSHLGGDPYTLDEIRKQASYLYQQEYIEALTTGLESEGLLIRTSPQKAKTTR
jgi:hypothetical protein